MELSSPPKPTRIVDHLMQNSKEGQTSGHEDFPTEDVINASRTEAATLPDLAGEVAVAQRQQINELSQRQEVRDRLKVIETTRKVYSSEALLIMKFIQCSLLLLLYCIFVCFIHIWHNQDNCYQGKNFCVTFRFESEIVLLTIKRCSRRYLELVANNLNSTSSIKD